MTPPSQPRSVIITAYRQPAALRLALLALARQTVLPDEVLIADDGSPPDLLEAVRALAPRLPFPLIHVWQPDQDFRAARSRNNAIHRARGGILLFLDQDTLPHGAWIEAHLRRLLPRQVALGLTLPLSAEQTAELGESQVSCGRFEDLHAPAAYRQLRRLQRKYAFYVLARRLGLGIKTRPALRSSNLAAWREDLLRVNGFDEEYVGWGQEDDDLGRRLYADGVQPLALVDSALTSHLHHPPRHADWKSGANIARYRRPLPSPRCAQGLDSHPHPDVRVTSIR